MHRRGEIFQGIGYLLIFLGILDFITGNFLGKDFTGVVWSPLALGIGGSILSWIGRKMNPDKGVVNDDLDQQ